jgi:hypothetical protein
MRIPKRINPIARTMLRNRRSPQVIPNKKKNYVPDIDDYNDVYIDTRTGKIQTHDDDIDPKDDPHDEMFPTKPTPKK